MEEFIIKPFELLKIPPFEKPETRFGDPNNFDEHTGDTYEKLVFAVVVFVIITLVVLLPDNRQLFPVNEYVTT